MFKCEFCNNEFICKSTLIKHMKTAAYCVKIQEIIRNKNSLKCDKCSKIFATKQTLRNHQLVVCKSENDAVMPKDLEELKDLINKLTINKGPPVVQNMEPITVAQIEAMALEYLDIIDIENGIQGIVDFTIKYPLQNRVRCTDKSRRKFCYTDESGTVINDYGGAQLSQTIFKGIQTRCVELIDQKYTTMATDIQTAVDNGDGYSDSVLIEMKKGVDLQNFKNSLLDAAKGTENDFQKGYIRKLVKKFYIHFDPNWIKMCN